VLRGRSTARYLQLAGERQWLPREEIVRRQLEDVRRLVAHAFKNVPFYEDFARQHGLTAESIDDFTRFRMLPLIDRETFNRERPSLGARNLRRETLSKSTGGTTGIPLHFGYTRESYEWRRAMSMRGYGWAGCLEGDKTVYLWGTLLLSQSSLIDRLKNNLYRYLLRQKYLNVFYLTPETMGDYLRQIHRYGPKHIVGLAKQVYNFARFIRQNNLEAPRVDSVILAAEKIGDEEKKLVGEVFHCDVYETYGSREFMLIAAECRAHGGLHVSAENLYVEILRGNEPARPGELGDIVITDLHNYGMPFIRYKIGDVAVASDETCPCGRGLPLIKNIEGRLMDIIITPEKRLLSGVFFAHLLKEFKAVQRYQVVQESVDGLKIRVVAAEPGRTTLRSGLEREVRHAVGETMKIEVEFVESIPLTSTGKYRQTISTLPPTVIEDALSSVRPGAIGAR
jgi:phenylacetate-CoA ligase